MMWSAEWHPYVLISARIILTVVGGYAASAGLVAALSAILPLLGLARSEAVILSSMFGFIAYLALLLWGFAARRPYRYVLALVFLVGSGLVVFLIGVDH